MKCEYCDTEIGLFKNSCQKCGAPKSTTRKDKISRDEDTVVDKTSEIKGNDSPDLVHSNNGDALCDVCGSKLETSLVFDSFDKITGERYYRKYLRCKKKNFFNSNHYDYVVQRMGFCISWVLLFDQYGNYTGKEGEMLTPY
jgi:formate dehydrogenase maturation protein FdhE